MPNGDEAMKRLLVVAGDRALTKFVTEAVLDRALDTLGPRRSDPWDVARAHTGLEAYLLLTKGGRPFDLIIVDQRLPDQATLTLLEKFRTADAVHRVPVFLMSERGRDHHSRRIAVERYGVSGFIEKPVSAESIRIALGYLSRKRQILLVESNAVFAERCRSALSSAGYEVDVASQGKDALPRGSRLRAPLPTDVVIVSLELEDMRGSEVCAEIKRHRERSIPVMLYGRASALPGHEISENALRSDDFIQTPFTDEVLCERVAQLIGRATPAGSAMHASAAGSPSPGGSAAPLGSTPGSTSSKRRGEKPEAAPKSQPLADTVSGLLQLPSRDITLVDAASPPAPAPPPASASPAVVGPTQRTTRRVPCQLSMSFRNGDRLHESKTLDISHGGIFIEIAEPPALGTLIDITFQLPGTSRKVNAVGKIVWIGQSENSAGNGATAGAGVKFSKIDPQDLQLIVDYVNRVGRVVYASP